MKIILSGPSGVGKDTLIDKWIERNPSVKRVVTATTREQRPGEIDGVSYHFYTVQEMEQRIANDEFLEYKNVFGNIYGTPKSSVDSIVNSGGVAIIRVDVQGAIELMLKMTDAITVFILPPSLEELNNRINERKTETKEKIKERMDTAVAEIACSVFYAHHVVNDDLSAAVDRLENILNGIDYKNLDLARSIGDSNHSKEANDKIREFMIFAGQTILNAFKLKNEEFRLNNEKYLRD